MADKKPLVLTSTGDIQQIQTGDTLGVVNGGTGATTASTARTNLGVAIGTDVEAHDATLDALAGLDSSTGMVVETAADTFTKRSVAVASTARLTVANADGAAGNPTLDLAALSDAGTGSLVKITRDSYGRVGGTVAVAAGDLTPLLDATYVNVSGDTMTGALTLNADPVNPLHAATKQYVDGVASGMDYKASVRAATTGANITLAGGAPSTIDTSITLVAGDRILVKDQTAPAENGIYVVQTLGTGANGTWVRATDADSSVEVTGGMTCFVNEGTTNADSAWTLITNDPITLGTTSLTFTQTSGLGQVTAGAGLTKTGNQLDVVSANTTRVVVNADSIDLGQPTIGGSGAAAGITKVTVDVYGRVTNTGAATASDVGAQPVDATLTALAGLDSTTGMVVETAADTFTKRSLAVASTSRLTVTNADGAAGNPTLDLATSGASAGTYTSVTVDVYGRVTSATNPVNAFLGVSLTNQTGSTIAKFSALYKTATADQVALANAGASGTMRFIGLASAAINNATSGTVYTDGTVAGTTAEWDAVTGQTGGLTPGAVYYLSTATAGHITSTAPTSGWLVQVGVAISSTQMLIQKNQPIQF